MAQPDSRSDVARHGGACKASIEQYCSNGAIQTYGSEDRDGTITQGGYSSHVVVTEDFVLRIPRSNPAVLQTTRPQPNLYLPRYAETLASVWRNVPFGLDDSSGGGRDSVGGRDLRLLHCGHVRALHATRERARGGALPLSAALDLLSPKS